MLLTRRGLITGLASLVAAPAIVRASSLMPVRAWSEPLGVDQWLGFPLLMDGDARLYTYVNGAWRLINTKAQHS